MFTRSQAYTIKIVICTSLIWLLLDTVILMNIRDCPSEHTNTGPGNVKRVDEPSTNFKALDNNAKTDKPGFLKRILPAVFSPDDRGEMGRAVIVPDQLKAKAKKLFSVNEFNLVASDLVSVNRTLRDIRMSECISKQYAPLESMGSTSVIVVFHNEAWSTLLRTVHSIINRSPPRLLHEIILVDDASIRDFLGAPLDKYMAELTVTVHVLRVKKRTGLIRARLRGAEKASGKILTFLDSHCECSKGWLEPIMHEIYLDRTSVVCPVIDVINDENFQYIPGSDMTYGGFNWRLNFRWYSVPQRENDRRKGDRSIPLRTPTMAGGLFSINRDYFYEIGSYDQGMDIWGAENLEMSFRVWMCGGTLLIATCSHVGHVFRKQTPYRFPGGGTSRVIARNNARLAGVWMDGWARVYFAAVGNTDVLHTDLGDISERIKLREKLKCKSFKWYLQNIYPESQMPIDYLSLGDIRTKKGDMCMDTLNNKAGTPLTVMKCHNSGGNQMWLYNNDSQLQQNDVCLISKVTNKVIGLKTKITIVTTKKCKWKSVKDGHKWIVNDKLFVYTSNLAIQSDDLAIVVQEGAVNFGQYRYALDKWAYNHKKSPDMIAEFQVESECREGRTTHVIARRVRSSDRSRVVAQAFLISRTGGLWRNSDFCVDGQKPTPYLFPCYPATVNSQQRWGLSLNRSTHTLSIRHIATNKCLTQNGKNVRLEKCNENDNQQWIIKDLKWKSQEHQKS